MKTKKPKPKQRTNWKVALAAVLLATSAFAQYMRPDFQGPILAEPAQQQDTQYIYASSVPSSIVFTAPDSQTLNLYREPHDGHFIEIKKGEKVIFSLTPDGKSEHTDEYKPDAVTVQFWKSLMSAFGQACGKPDEASK